MPKKTVADIKASGNDYVIGVKKNQPTLYQQIVEISQSNTPIDMDYTLEKNKGRIEQRAVLVYEPIGIDCEQWVGLEQVVQVERMIQYPNGKTSQETHYYIDSSNSTAPILNMGIRAHWGIENTLHHSKDVTFKEDASLIRIGNAPRTISVVKNWVMAMFTLAGFSNMASAIRLVANDFEQMVSLLE